MISDAFAYPLRGSGRLLIVIGSVLAALVSFGSSTPIVGGAAAFLGLVYFMAYYIDIIVRTVSGEDEPPDFPDVSDLYDDIIGPLLRTAFAQIISFLPFFIILTMHRGGGGAPAGLQYLGLIFAALYYPMAMLNVAVSNDAWEALPHRVLPGIMRTMPQYLLLAVLLAAVFLISGLITPGLGIPFIGPLISSAATLYLSMVQARMAGVFYRERLEDLAVSEESAPKKTEEEAPATDEAPAAPAESTALPAPPAPARVIPPPPPRK
jgi:hypothetical protein